MSKITKESLLKLIAKAGEKSALIGCGSASLLGYHQPKEPVNIQKNLQNKD